MSNEPAFDADGYPTDETLALAALSEQFKRHEIDQLTYERERRVLAS